MRRMVLLTLIGCAVSIARGQAEVHLANGAVLKGNVTRTTARRSRSPSSSRATRGATATYRYDQLAPQTIYRLRLNKTARDDVKGQLELAAYALDNGVFRRRA